MAEPFQVKPEDYLPGGRLYGTTDYYVSGGGKIVEDKKTGVGYAPGSVAIPVTKAADYASLPAEVKAILGGTDQYNPFAKATGFAYDPKTGTVAVETGPGNFMTLGAKFGRGPQGQFQYSEDLTFPNTSTVSSDSTTTTAALAAKQAADAAAEAKRAAGQSAYNILFEQFQQYGLGALIEPLKGFIVEGLSPAEFTIRLRDTDAYKKRFAANAQRINKGLRALSEAEYIGLEDQYQNVMRNYGLPESYYAKGDMGTQAGFEKFIAGDVSAAELEDRIQTAQNRVLYANPEVATALKQFYPDITNGDILAYALDPQQALTNIKRKVTAAEIGAGALQAGLQTDLAKAEALRGYGVTGEQAKQGYQAIAGYLPRASTLADIYGKQGMGPFTQGTAEAEVFGTPGAAEAAQKRRKLTELEQASFSGSAGRAGGALARERAGQF